MVNHELNTESKILEAAIHAFLLFGYHGIKLHVIADKAGVNRAALYYYFRSKEKLYKNVAEKVFGIFFSSKSQIIPSSERLEEIRWFFYTELYNNKELFEKTLQELYPQNWVKNLSDIRSWIDNTTIHFPNP